MTTAVGPFQLKELCGPVTLLITAGRPKQQAGGSVVNFAAVCDLLSADLGTWFPLNNMEETENYEASSPSNL